MTLAVELTSDPLRLLGAGGLAAAWLAASVLALRPRRVRSSDTLVVHASQTGQAAGLARRTAARLAHAAGGRAPACVSLGDLSPQDLVGVRRLLCVAATSGEGEAPDAVQAFARRMMHERPDLSGLEFVVLALGDRRYEKFCRFGVDLDRWLSACGAQPLSPCLTADNLDAATLAAWDQLLASLGATGEEAGDHGFRPWRLVERTRLNPGSPGEGLWRLMLEPADGVLPDWQAGDLVEIRTPAGAVRTYSIASLPDEGALTLLVREMPGPSGELGPGSRLLTRDCSVGGEIFARLRANEGFRAPSGRGAVLVVCAGSGLAGVRPHVLSMPQERHVWLVLGERDPTADRALAADAEKWRDAGRLERLDLVFSREDGGASGGEYVQDRIVARGDEVRSFLGAGGAVMVCGRLAMGKGVEASLRLVLGDAWVERARDDGRYRRDLY